MKNLNSKIEELLESDLFKKESVSAIIRNACQGEPNERFFLLFDEYALGDDGLVYQCVSKDDAVSFLIYDAEEFAFNYAEDGEQYDLLNEKILKEYIERI